MGAYTFIQNTSITIDPVNDFADTGWIVSGNTAFHDGCNSGSIKYNLDLTGHASWTFKYKLGPVISGGINIVVNGVNGIVRNAPGEYAETFAITGANVPIAFFSDGTNSVELLQSYPVLAQSNSETFVFNEDENLWGGNHDYKPEFMHQYIMDSFFVFKNGQIWEQDVNPIYNNWFGEQFTSKIKIIANDKANSQKRYFGMKIDSNQKWGVSELQILPNETYPNGMKSMLHENNFTLDKGEYWADFLRDMNDPQFWPDQAKSIFEGRELEGKILILEMECKSISETELKAIYIYSTEKFRNF